MNIHKKVLSMEDKRKIVLQEFDNLIKSSKRLQKPKSLEKVKKAFHFADNAHKGQFRKTGQKMPYIIHPISVAKIIATEMGFGSTTVAAALLHDVAEDTDYTIENIRKVFGNDIAFIVNGLTKITHVFNPKRTEQAETFINLILKMSKDKRIAFIKIADRLHNLRTMDGIKESSQMIKTAESLDVYAPLAHQLGLFEIKKEIEDISFRLRENGAYLRIKKLVEDNKESQEKTFQLLSNPISKELKKNNYDFKIEPITKSLYRTWEIIKHKKIELNEIHNFLTVRIIFKPEGETSEKQQCYALYAILTDLFVVESNKLIDKITTPKKNGFEALISSVMLGGEWAEVQIMTERMNEIAKRGYAKNHDNKHLENIEKWGRSLTKIFDNKELTNQEIIEIVKPQDNEIHVFTPKGDLITLPKGATALDFAFRIHTYLGLKFVAAQINKRTVGYDFKLSNAEQVKIISSSSINPQKEWENALVCSRNKAELKRYFSKEKKKIIKEGKVIFNYIIAELETKKIEISKYINHFNCKNKEDFFYRIGTKTIMSANIKQALVNKQNSIGKIFEYLFVKKDIQNIETKKTEKNNIIFDPKKTFLIDDIDKISLSQCCSPIPGNPSIVHHTSDSKFIIHRRNCIHARELNSSDRKKTAVVKWGTLVENVFKIKIKFSGIDKKGLLIEILQIISKEMDINMTKLFAKTTKNIFKGTIELEVKNADNLQKIINEIRKIKEIIKVHRYQTNFKL